MTLFVFGIMNTLLCHTHISRNKVISKTTLYFDKYMEKLIDILEHINIKKKWYSRSAAATDTSNSKYLYFIFKRKKAHTIWLSGFSSILLSNI